METVKQKVALAQQLEMWEVDMQIMKQEQLRDKVINNQSQHSTIRENEKAHLDNKSSVPSSLISFFLRTWHLLKICICDIKRLCNVKNILKQENDSKFIFLNASWRFPDSCFWLWVHPLFSLIDSYKTIAIEWRLYGCMYYELHNKTTQCNYCGKVLDSNIMKYMNKLGLSSNWT